LAQRAIPVPGGKKMASQITNAIENPANDRISGASPHQQVTTVMTVTVSHLSIRGIGHENDDAIGAYRCHRHWLIGVRPVRRPRSAPRQVDASGRMGIAPARLERAAGSISEWANWPVNDDVAAQARTNSAVVRAFAPEADRRSDVTESGGAELLEKMLLCSNTVPGDPSSMVPRQWCRDGDGANIGANRRREGNCLVEG
jgi:hypothetical protein